VLLLLALGQYMGGEGMNSNFQSVDEVIAYMRGAITNNASHTAALKRDAIGAAARGLPWHGYEGGNWGWSNASGLSAKVMAMFDPRMRSIVKEYMDLVYSLGMVTMNIYTGDAGVQDDKYGDWPAASDVASPNDSPKFPLH
jgi:hypothetical protein